MKNKGLTFIIGRPWRTTQWLLAVVGLAEVGLAGGLG